MKLKDASTYDIQQNVKLSKLTLAMIIANKIAIKIKMASLFVIISLLNC